MELLMSTMRWVARELLPPLLVRWLRRLEASPDSQATTYEGDYPSLQAARQACGSLLRYEDAATVARLVDKLKPQLQSASPPECPPTIQELLAGLLRPLLERPANRQGEFRVLDFGGGPGVHYFQLQPRLPGNLKLCWDVVETPLMAQACAAIQAPGLRYLTQMPQELYDCVICSATIQFLPQPAELLAQFAQRSRYALVTRVPIIPDDQDRFCVQTVPAEMVASQCPMRLFGAASWQRMLEPHFDLALRWDLPTLSITYRQQRVPFQGFLLRSRAV